MTPFWLLPVLGVHLWVMLRYCTCTYPGFERKHLTTIFHAGTILALHSSVNKACCIA